MSPIRVGIIGVGATSNSAGTGTWGASAHLPALRASPHYKIVAIVNSSVESAKASIAFHKLDSDVKAYGNVEDLVKDPDVDLAVVSINVAKHYALTKPLLLAGKDVFVEWPLGADTAQYEELADLAKSHNVKTIVGTQGRVNPLTRKIKELVNSGRIGTVLSSTVAGSFLGMAAKAFPVSMAYYASKDSGGNNLTIFYGHFLDSFNYVLGNFTQLHAITKTAYPTIDLLGPNGEIVTHNYPKTAPDHIFVHGTLESNAMVSVNFREVDGSTVSGDGIRWTITGTEGEIEMTVPQVMWQIGTPGATLKMRAGNQIQTESIASDLEGALQGKVEDVPFEDETEPDYIKGLSLAAKGVARTWEAYAKGETEKYATFEDARALHRTLDAIRAGSL